MTWEEHIKQAEMLLDLADQPGTTYDQDRMLNRAQVHATLAMALKDTVSVRQRQLPEVFG